jgi:glycerol-3-phosphate dehydrogenase subunit C
MTAALSEHGLIGHELARASLDQCLKCTICETMCPVARVTQAYPGPKFIGPQAERYRHGESVDHSLDYCSSCGTCTLVCPQGVQIAEMISQARAVMKADDMPLRDRLISQTVLMGKAMAPVAPIANAALQVKPVRVVLEKTVGIHRDAPMPRSCGRSFESWFKKHKRAADAPAPTRGKLVFFHGCAGNYFEVATSQMSVEVLEHLGYEVVVPHHGCCGLAEQSNGLFAWATKDVLRLCDDLAAAGPGLPIVSASGSCTGMLKHEAHEIMGVRDARLDDVGGRIVDIMEFLWQLHEAGELPASSFQRIEATVPYHAPCQLKGQRMGMPALDVLGLIPGLTVRESGQPCCGIAGTYGLKAEKYDIAQAVGAPVFAHMRTGDAGFGLCDTETCRWQIAKGAGVRMEHPIYLVHQAMGLSPVSVAV